MCMPVVINLVSNIHLRSALMENILQYVLGFNLQSRIKPARCLDLVFWEWWVRMSTNWDANPIQKKQHQFKHYTYKYNILCKVELYNIEIDTTIPTS